MILFIFALLFSSIIVVIGILKRKYSTIETDITNDELEKFYGMISESPSVQLRQLVLAVKTLLKNFAKISKEKETVSNLYDERIISDKYYKKLKTIEEELIIEKTLIENEADSIKQGAKDSVFFEANKLMNTENMTQQRKKLFDEGNFLKKQDLLKQKFKEATKNE